MVTFVSLFLSLVTGVHTVELAVGSPVAALEVRLDGTTIAELEAPPWRVRCDFGPRLEPHELLAVAFDAHGNEIDRARQLVNLPRPPAETRVSLERDPGGLPSRVRVFWESADGVRPLSVFASFDGRPLQPEGAGSYLLPHYDPHQVHIVSAEAQFMDGINARSDVTFGGRYGSQVVTELTAVPISVDGEPPTVESLEGAFRARGRELRVAAVEQPGEHIYLVRDHATLPRLAHLRYRQDRMSPYRANQRTLLSRDPKREDDQLHLVNPNPELLRGRRLFPTTTGIELDSWPLQWLATHLTSQEASLVNQRLADAVAVAGVQAAADGSPRGVLLLLTSEARDDSHHRVDEVRRYLSELRVPLFVWTTGEAPPPGWGRADSVSTARGLRRAARTLRRSLARQWVVWLDGNHMVNEVELAGDYPGIRLAGQ